MCEQLCASWTKGQGSTDLCAPLSLCVSDCEDLPQEADANLKMGIYLNAKRHLRSIRDPQRTIASQQSATSSLRVRSLLACGPQQIRLFRHLAAQCTSPRMMAS